MDHQQLPRLAGQPDLIQRAVSGLLDLVDCALAISDADGILRWCNQAFVDCHLTARATGEWLGRPMREALGAIFGDGDSLARIDAALARLPHAAKGRVEIESLPLRLAGRAVRVMDLVLSDLAAGSPLDELPGKAPREAPPAGPGLVGWYFQDVTRRKRVEENLHALVRHSTDGIFIVDAEGRLRVYNEACERITGYRADEVARDDSSVGRIFRWTRRHAEGAPREGLICTEDFCLRDGQPAPITREYEIVTRDARRAWLEIGYAPVSDENGRIDYVLGIVRDVTPRRELEDQLRLARKLATIGELSSAMAHEIKNPLGIILSAAEIIGNPSRPEEQRLQAAEFIRDEARRLNERIQVFLRFSRPRPIVMQSQDVHPILSQTLAAYRTLARPGLEIAVEFDERLPHVRIDADQMQQVFLNLLLNADQAMHAGGTILVRTAPGQGRDVRIEVADEGMGIPEKELQRLFEPFYSTKPRGTGLGLSIAMHIVTAHQGRIEARNRPEGGALFVVTLPVPGSASP